MNQTFSIVASWQTFVLVMTLIFWYIKVALQSYKIWYIKLLYCLTKYKLKLSFKIISSEVDGLVTKSIVSQFNQHFFIQRLRYMIYFSKSSPEMFFVVDKI